MVLLTAATELSAQGTSTDVLLHRIDGLESAVHDLEAKVDQLNTLLRKLIPSPIQEIQPIDLTLTGAQTRGSQAAKIVIIEFSDFQCPFCGQHARTAFPELMKQFVDTGQVRYVFRNLPIEKLHPSAMKAAESAQCAAAQGKFWEMHDKLFANQEALSTGNLAEYASAVGVQRAQFDSCLAEGRTSEIVREDLAEGTRLGITATPTFLIGQSRGDTVHVTRRITGTQQFEVFRDAVQGLADRVQ